MTDTSKSNTISTKQERIATLARTMPTAALRTIAQHIDIEWLHQAYRLTRKDGAVGVDGQTAAAYEVDLEANLQSLLNRAKTGDTYRAPPVRRVEIPKGSGEMRPIGIPTFEDKVLQRAVVMALEPLYEQDFYDCSYGFRPGRSPHQALQSLRNQLMEMHGGWLVEIDIRSFFDSVDHRQLRAILSQRMQDGVLLRLIGKWLKAGVVVDGIRVPTKTGTPQGGVISPLLANIFLHTVLDVWFASDVQSRLGGRSFMVRFADDAVLAFDNEGDARRVMAVLAKRFAKYGLTLHPTKTKLTCFKRPRKWPIQARARKPETFDLLGFTHFWGLSRHKKWVIKVKTAKSRLVRSLGAINQWLKSIRHWKIRNQHGMLCNKMKGHYGYFGITHNIRSLNLFHQGVRRLWLRWLNRRNQRRHHNWEWFLRLLSRYPLPQPKIVHSYVM